MSELKEPKPAKLVMALLYSQPEILSKSKVSLEKHFGQIEWKSPEFEFNHTSYYTEEMGEGLKKSLIGFNRLISPEELPEIKIFAHQLEKELTHEGKRQINIDPGYLTLDRLVLATGKDAAHRIYLRKGVYAEVTLIYHSGSFQSLPWSYPDYRSEQVISSLNQFRKNMLKPLNRNNEPDMPNSRHRA